MWLYLSILAAAFGSALTLSSKKILKEVDLYLFLWMVWAISCVVLLLGAVYVSPLPHPNVIFYSAIAVAGILDTVALIMAFKAIQASEVSLLTPVGFFSPIFTSLLAFSVLGESLSGKGLTGIVVVCLGAYIMEISHLKSSPLAPLKTLLKNKSVELTLGANLIWAVTPVLQKAAIQNSGKGTEIFTAFVDYLIVLVGLSLIILKRKPKPFYFNKNQLKWMVLAGLLAAISIVFTFAAFTANDLGYVTAVFNLGIIFTVILSHIFFKEHDFKSRLFGALVMLAGLFLLI